MQSNIFRVEFDLENQIAGVGVDWS
jgi:hypothetical protein